MMSQDPSHLQEAQLGTHSGRPKAEEPRRATVHTGFWRGHASAAVTSLPREPEEIHRPYLTNLLSRELIFISKAQTVKLVNTCCLK